MITFLTGASSGIGQALAPLFAKDGDAVVLAARRREPIEALAAKIQQSGGRALPVVCNVSDRTSVAVAVRLCEDHFGPVERLVANAGINDPSPSAEFSSETVERVMRTNYLGMTFCIEAVLPGMLQNGRGQIAGIASLAGFRGLPGSGAYSASKAAQIALLESLRIELQDKGIIVTIVSPGFIRTAMTEKKETPMPFLMDVDKAARIIHRAIVSRKSHKTFPWPMALLAKVGRWVPDALYDWSFHVTGLETKKKKTPR